MTTIQCNNSTTKAVSFFLNGGYGILVFAEQCGEYWFTIGRSYKTAAGAKKAAKKQMGVLGYTFDEKALEDLVIE